MKTTTGSVIIGVLQYLKQISYKKVFFFICIVFSLKANAQLVINEVSQGPSGAKEYVELLVVGTPTCNSIPCMDLRGYYIDDNNGNHATGAGTGIAQGCVHFTNDALWSCVPVGTLIVIYNDADLNASIPSTDLSLSDGNCKLVIPVSNCTLLEKHTTQPSTGTAVYPTSGFSSCGNWTNISMANSDDSFQTIDASGNLVFSVSWGNNTTADIIYFAGAQTGLVSSMTNSTDNNPSNQANWVKASVAGNETPGAPNNAANAAWIQSMNNNCTALTPLTTTISTTNAGCSCNGSASVTTSGAIAPYTYVWAPSGGTSSTASGLCAGNYTVTVTSSNGCVVTATTTINSSSSFSTSVASSSVTCNATATGSATVTPVGGTGSITYTWSPSGGNSSVASSLSAGNYTVTSTDAAGCVSTKTVTISQPTALTAIPTQTNVLCNGVANGSASVSASGGSGPYTYSWSPGGGNGATETGLAAGNYTVQVKDANNCLNTQTVSITQPSSLTLTASSTSVTCVGNNGTASALGAGGSGAYTYTWTPTGGNSANASGLAGGTYTVSITDVNGCTKSASTFVSQPISFSVSINTSSVTCNAASTGSATATVSGGSGPFLYTWSPTGGNLSTTSGLSAGNYSLTTIDASGCSKTTTITIYQPPSLTVTPTFTNVLCNGSANGIANVSVSGGTGAYTYTWLPSGGNTPTAIGISAGSYTAIISDANNCQSSQNITITQPAALSLSATTTSATCAGNNGTATAVVSGGTGVYTYTWLPSGGNNQNASGLSGGTYTLAITDANGCTKNTSAIVAQPSSFSLTTTSNSVSCNGGNNGTASVVVTGGTGPFTYSWTPSGGTNSNAAGLTSGNYSVTVTDPNGCTKNSSLFISEPPVLSITPTQTNIACNGNTNGIASIIVTGGTGAYTYSWSPSGFTGNTATGLSAGSYSVLISDANNCTNTQNFTITEPTLLTLTASTTSTTCSGNTGTASAVVNGGIGPYTYTWSPSGGNTASVSGLGGGTYTVSVNDANGCTANTSAFVFQPVSFSVTISTNSVSCNLGSDGSATATLIGGIGPFTYAWLPSGGISNTASGLSSGNYSVTVTDPNGCNFITSTSITQPSAITATITSTNILCNGGSNGTASVTAIGGTGTYNYLWAPSGGSLSSANSLTAGAYSVTITDANGCSSISTTTILQPNVLSLSTATTAINCNGGTNGSAAVTATGGISPYTYNWVGGSTNSIITNLPAGTYTVNVVDVNGCTQSTTATVSQPPSISINISSSPAACGLSNGSATAVVTGGVSPYSYTWSPSGITTLTANGLSAGNYTLNVSDANNCSNFATTTVINTGNVSVSVTNTNVSCNGGSDGLALANASGGNLPYDFSWSNGSLTATASNLMAGVYTVTVTDNNNCVQTATITINQPSPVVVVSTATTICSGQTAVLSASASGGTAPYSFSWDSALPQQNNTITISPILTNTYAVIAIDSKNCPSTVFTTTATVLPPLQVNAVGATICVGNSANLTASASGGNNNYIYNWLPGNLTGNTISVSPNSTTVYTVTVTDGCTTSGAIDTGLVNVVNIPVLSLQNSVSGCAPQCISFAIPTNTNVIGWLWNLGDNSTSTIQNPVHCYNKSGSYNVSLTYTTLQGCINTITQNNLVTVFPSPIANFSASSFDADIYNMNISFYNQSVGIASWDWSFGDANYSTLYNPTHEYSGIGNYLVTLVVTNQKGCKDSVTKEIKIHDDYTFYAPNAFSPNEDGMNDEFKPTGTGWDLTTYKLWVFDRWGNEIFKTTDTQKGWKGKYRNEETVQEDTYVWKVELQDIFGKAHEYNGTISLIK